MEKIKGDEEIIISRKLGEAARIAGISTNLLIPWAYILVGVLIINLIINTVVKVPPILFIYLYIVGVISHWQLLRKKPWKFGGKFIGVPDWTLGYPSFEYKKGIVSKEKVGKKKIGSWSESKRVVKPIEDELDLITLVEYRLGNKPVGAYLLKKKGRYKLVFIFELAGINHNADAETIFSQIALLQEGLRSLPNNETVTIVVRRMSSCKKRLAILEKLHRQANSSPVKFMIEEIAKRTKQSRKQKKHNPVVGYVRITHTLGDTDESDAIESILASLEAGWLKYIGSKPIVSKARIRKNLTQGYYQGYIPGNLLLRERLGLSISPMTASEIYQSEYGLINPNRTVPVKAPQTLVITQNRMWFECNNSTHLCTHLYLHSLPVADRGWVYLPGIKKYVGGVVLVEKPGKLKKALPQLKIASEIVNSISDLEVVIELSAPDQREILDRTRWRVKDSHINSKISNEKGKIDRKAKRNLDEDVAVEDKFYDHELAVNMAWVAMPYRDNPIDLEIATSKIEKLKLFSSPAEVAREKEYFPQIYLSTLATTWQKMLVAPFYRRKMFFSQEVPGLLPLAYPRVKKSDGLEYIAKDGYTPVYAELYDRDFPRHMGIIGESGSGKSFQMGAAGSLGLANDMNVTIIDSTREDGTGTFTDWTNFHEGSYYNCLDEKINILEIEDTSCFEPIKAKAVNAINNQLMRQSILAMVIEADTPSNLSSRYRRLIDLALHAYREDPQIKERWRLAHIGGRGSSAWLDCPTLKDLRPFLEPQNGSLTAWVGGELSDEQKSDLASIRLAIEAVIHSPLGDTICGPTTICFTSPLVTIGIGGIDEEKDLEILAIAAHSVAVRRAISSSRSLIIFDEASYLVGNFDCMSRILGALMAKSRKLGATVIWGGQDLASILNCRNAKQILDNTTHYSIGKLAPTATTQIATALEIPRQILLKNTYETFGLPATEFATPWLFKDREVLHSVRLNLAFVELALLLNQPFWEQKRKEFFNKYPNKYEAIARFAEYYISTIKNEKGAF